jgi:hypothetical protein
MRCGRALLFKPKFRFFSLSSSGGEGWGEEGGIGI